MTGFNHICLTDNSLYVSMVMTLITFLSLVGSLKGLSLDPCYFYYIYFIYLCIYSFISPPHTFIEGYSE